MSKRRLNTLKGKKLVTGDANLMTKDEICINATPNGVEVKEIGKDGKIKDLAGSGDNSSSGNSDLEILYYKNGLCGVDSNSLSDGERFALDLFFYFCDAILSVNDVILPGMGKLYSVTIMGKSDDAITAVNNQFKIDFIKDIKAFSEYKTAKEIKMSYNDIFYSFEFPAQSFIENYKYYMIKYHELKIGASITEDILENINYDVAVLYKYFTPITKEEYDNLATQN